MNEYPTARDVARLAWARTTLADVAITLQRASTDAGFRSYWRTCGHVSSPATASMIVMDSPPDKEDVRPWLRIRDLLESGGVRVPQVLARDVENGFLLLEDLGVDTYLQVLDDDNADAMFDAAVTQLLKLQAIAPPADLPGYDEALLSRELRLFDEWFLGRHLGVTLDCGELEALELVYRRLIDASLDHYHARAFDAGLPVPTLAQFRRDADWIGVQRHLKVLGIFARLQHRDHKPKYLVDAPRFVAYLDDVLPRHPELQPLLSILDRHVRPALAVPA